MYLISITVATLYFPLTAAIDDTAGDVEDAPFCEKAMELSCGLPTEHCLFWDAYACQFTNLKDLCPKWCNASLQGRKMFNDPLADEATIDTDKEPSICFFTVPKDCLNKYPVDICLKMQSHACSIPKVGKLCKATCEKDINAGSNETDINLGNITNEYLPEAVDASFCDKAISTHCGEKISTKLCKFWDAYACEYHNLNRTCPTNCRKSEKDYKILLSANPFTHEEQHNNSGDKPICDVLFPKDCLVTNSEICSNNVLHSCNIPAVAQACSKICAKDNLNKEADTKSSFPLPSAQQQIVPQPSFLRSPTHQNDNLLAFTSKPKPTTPKASFFQSPTHLDYNTSPFTPKPSDPKTSTPRPYTSKNSTPKSSGIKFSYKKTSTLKPSNPKHSTTKPSTPKMFTPQTSIPISDIHRTSTPNPSIKTHTSNHVPTYNQSSTNQSSTNQSSTNQSSTNQSFTNQSSIFHISTHQSSDPATLAKLVVNDNDMFSIETVPGSHFQEINETSEKLKENTSVSILYNEEEVPKSSLPQFPAYLSQPPVPSEQLVANDSEAASGPTPPKSPASSRPLSISTPAKKQTGKITEMREDACCEKVLSSACGLSEELCELWKAYACSYRGFDEECPTLCDKVATPAAIQKKVIPLMLRKMKMQD